MPNRSPFGSSPSSPNSSRSSCPAPNPNDYKPVIGILSHPRTLNNAIRGSVIAASYVKFVKAAGARVIPLVYDEPPATLLKKLELVNGVLFTGGWATSGLYFETVGTIFKKVLEKNNGVEYFPLYAVCLGFELLMMIISEDNKILEKFRASDPSTLQFVENASIEGTVFQNQSFPSDLQGKLKKDRLAMQSHCQGISPGKFLDNDKLSTFFEILTTCEDEDDKVYVSTVRSRNYPVTGFQWHPEKNAFEWGAPGIPHTEDAIQVTHCVANFLGSEARKSLNRPDAQEVLGKLISDDTPTYAWKTGSGSVEFYIFS